MGKNVLMIADMAAPYRGNFIPSLERLEQLYAQQGRVVYLFPSVAEHIEWMQDFKQHHKVYFIERSYNKKLTLANVRLLKQIVREYKIGIIHSHFGSYNVTLFVLKRLFGSSVKFIQHIHGEHVNAMTWKEDIRLWSIRHTFDEFIACGPAVEKSFKPLLKHSKLITISNGVDFSRLETPIVGQASDSNKGQNETKNILMFGWPFNIKGIDIALKAVEKVRKQGYEVSLNVILSGDRKRIEQQMRSVCDGKMPDWVSVLPPRPDVVYYYNNADVFLSCSRTEGLSYAVLEASMCECEMVVSNIAGNALDIPTMGIFKAEDVEDCAAKLSGKLKLTKEERQTNVAVRKAYVTEHYSLDTWAKQVIEQYQN